MTVRILKGDCRDVLRELEPESVHCVVTSPPYWGLRDYGVAGQIGLEGSFAGYVEIIRNVFDQVRRVLRKDGTVWLNLGDSYATGAGKVGDHPGGGAQGERWKGGPPSDKSTLRGNGHVGGGPKLHALDPVPANRGVHTAEQSGKQGYRIEQMGPMTQPNQMPQAGLKPKDLCGIPWRVAFALQADGWVLRQEIIWQKPNPMPESVTDRCTKSHEQIFMFAKARWSGPQPGRYSHISEQDGRWLALFLDAEGNLCLRRESPKGNDYGAHSAQIGLANSHRPLLELAASIVGDGSVLERPGINAPMYYWQLCGKKAADLLARVYPYLIVKQRQARCLLHLETRKAYRGGHERLAKDEIEYRDRLWASVKELNHFGDPDISWVPSPQFGKWADCERYFYDAEAIAETSVTGDVRRPYGSEGAWQLDGRPVEQRHGGEPRGRGGKNAFRGQGHNRDGENGPANRDDRNMRDIGLGERRNRRSVWEIATAPFSEAHFATFPPALIEPCILAGCPKQACAKCGAPWVREVERKSVRELADEANTWSERPSAAAYGKAAMSSQGRDKTSGLSASNSHNAATPQSPQIKTVGFFPSCSCNAGTVPGTVLDPFGGAGTTGLVADRLGRNAILIELNPEYADMAERRLRQDAGMFAQVAAE